MGTAADRSAASPGVLGTVLLGLASVSLLALLWGAVFVVAGAFVGSGIGALIASGVAVTLLVAGAYAGVASERSPPLQSVASVLGIGFLTTLFVDAVWGVVFLLAAVVVDAGAAAAVAGAAAFAVAAVIAGALVLAFRNRGTAVTWPLALRMTLALLVLALFTTALLALVWLVAFAVSATLLGPAVGTYVAAAVALGVLAAIAYRESRQVSSIERRVDATPVSPDEYPELHAVVTRVATQLDVPKPTVAVARTRAPEAMVLGFRPSNAHLVLSEGTLDAVDEDELEAVVAHELAHVANRDAMVMTAVTVPVVLADRLCASLLGTRRSRRRSRRRSNDGDNGSSALVWLALLIALTVAWVLTRAMVASLSRAREVAADRTAARVTGSGAPLASALRTLDEGIEGTPEADLRDAAGVSALSILPLDPIRTEKPALGPEGNREPFLWSIRGPLKRLKKRLFGTHPATEERIERLRRLEREQE